MPINIFGNSSHNDNIKIDTSILLQKPYLRIKYIESKLKKMMTSKINIELKIDQILYPYEKQLQKQI